jgi:CBS domain-containing protein
MSERLTAGEVCTREVTFAYKGTALNEAARLMREHHVGSLVVVEETGGGRAVVGMLTDRDIVTSVVARDVDAGTLRVEDVMSADLVTAREGDSVMDVLASMKRKGVRRIPVTGPQGHLVGLVAADDLLKIIAEELNALAQALGGQRSARR